MPASQELAPLQRAEHVEHVRPWDNQLYPNLKSWMLKLDIAADGTMTLAPNFYVDFAPARAHEMRLPGGDVTTEIFS